MKCGCPLCTQNKCVLTNLYPHIPVKIASLFCFLLYLISDPTLYQLLGRILLVLYVIKPINKRLEKQNVGSCFLCVGFFHEVSWRCSLKRSSPGVRCDFCSFNFLQPKSYTSLIVEFAFCALKPASRELARRNSRLAKCGWERGGLTELARNCRTA